jgi:prepilin-type processing-associated H-X9-DG protein
MSNHRRGFALIELLILLALIGLVLAIVPPAILSSRDAARKAQCAIHLQLIGRAAAGFSDAHNQMLPYNQLSSPTGSWNTQLLPYLDKNELTLKYNPAHEWWESSKSENRAVAAHRIETFVCPAAPRPDRLVLTMDPETEGQSFLAAPTDYVGSAGAYYQDNQQSNLHAGAMHHRTLTRRLRLPDIVDGASQTLLIVEMADKPNSWKSGVLADDRSDKPQSSSLSGQWAAPNWNHLRSYSNDGTTAFGQCAVNCSNSASIYGFHKGGANVLFVDGSVRMLSARMSQELLIALVSYAGAEPIEPNEYVSLTSED